MRVIVFCFCAISDTIRPFLRNFTRFGHIVHGQVIVAKHAKQGANTESYFFCFLSQDCFQIPKNHTTAFKALLQIECTTALIMLSEC